MPKLQRAAEQLALSAEANRLKAEYLAKMREQQPVRLRADSSLGYGNMGAGFSRASGAKYPGGLSKPIGGNLLWHWGLRNQARDIATDSTFAYTIIHRKADTVIDRGLVLSATPIASVLGITDEEADKWAQAVNQSFELWANSTASHRSGLFNFKQAQHQTMVGKARDNDEFMRFYYSQRSDLPSPLQWEIIDANQIRGDAVTATNMMPFRFFDGIDRNPDGSERAYKIWYQPQGTSEANPSIKEATVPHIGEKSGRVMMIHGFQPEYAGQGRGYSQLGIVLQDLEDLQNYIMSVIAKARSQSQIIGHTVPSKDKPASNPFEQMGMPPAGPSPTYGFGATPATGGVSVNGSLDGSLGATAVPVMEATSQVPGAMFITNLDSGEEIAFDRDTSPSQEFGAFVDAYLTPILGSQGLSLEIFKIQFSTSYSSARAALATVYRFVEMERMWWDTWCGSAVYEAWLSCEIALGRISCPGWQDPRLRSAWCSHTFIGSPPVQIDPDKEASSAMKRLEMSATQLKHVVHEIGTGDLASNMAANTRDFKVLPIPSWQQKISVAATTVEESETKASDQAKQDLAVAKAGAPKPGTNGKPKPVGAR